MITHGKVAVIIEGSKGIGRACAECLLRKGAKVCIADVDEVRGRAAEADLVKAHGAGKVIFVPCDVTSPADVAGLFLEVQNRLGRLDIFCPATETLSEGDWQRCLDISYKGAVYATYEAIKYMSKQHGGDGGLVVFVTTAVAMEPSAKLPVYSASKYALVGFLGAWTSSRHFNIHGIRFNGLSVPHITSVAEPSLNYRLISKGFLRLIQDDFFNGRILGVMDKNDLNQSDIIKFPKLQRAWAYNRTRFI